MQALRLHHKAGIVTIASIALMSFTGCAPIGLAELRLEPPAQIASYKKPAGELAECTLRSMRNESPSMWGRSLGNLAWEITKFNDEMTHVSGRTPQHAFPIVDIQFLQTNSGTVVEIRRGGFEPRSNDSFFVEEPKKIIDRCAI